MFSVIFFFVTVLYCYCMTFLYISRYFAVTYQYTLCICIFKKKVFFFFLKFILKYSLNHFIIQSYQFNNNLITNKTNITTYFKRHQHVLFAVFD